MYNNAVVEVHAEFILLGAGGTGGSALAANVRADVILQSNGFFVRGHYIICPAHAVLLPPSLTSVVNRYPYVNPNTLALGTIRNEMVRASRIFVSVHNVNNKGHSFVYEAELVGVDGAGDLAVLKIGYKRQWNLGNPCVEKCHPYLCLGESRAMKDGEKVFALGGFIGNSIHRRIFSSSNLVSEGVLADHRYLDNYGFVLPECVLVSSNSYAFSGGVPFIDTRGHVIGMQTMDLAASLPVLASGITGNQQSAVGFVGGPSEFFMRKTIRYLIKGTCSRKYNPQVNTISDPVGSFYSYQKAYAGIAYDLFQGDDYDYTTDYTSGTGAFGQPQIQLDYNGGFVAAPNSKEIVGIRVLGLAGLNPNDAAGVTNGYWYVPGGTGTNGIFNGLTLPVSPFLGRLIPGDVITHIRGTALGDDNMQIAPSLMTWLMIEGDQLEITWRRGGNTGPGGATGYGSSYNNSYHQTGSLAAFPPLMDYPWYAINTFPQLLTPAASTVYPSFTAPAGQEVIPQFPAADPTTGAGIFHPAF